MADLNELTNDTDMMAGNEQKGTLIEFHQRLYTCIMTLWSVLRRIRGKQSKGSQRAVNRGWTRASTRPFIAGMICSDLKGTMTLRDRLNNRYIINFTDHKSNYCRVFLARIKDAAAKQFEHFLVFFETRFDCRIQTGVARQRSEANNQVSNGRAKLMHRTIMNMARCMIFGVRAAVELCRLHLEPVADKLKPGKSCTPKVLTKQTPLMGELVVFGSPCTVYRDPRNMNFSHRALEGLIIGISEETKGYRVYLPKGRVVVTTQQNEQVQRLYFQEENGSDAETVGNVDAGTASGRVKKKKKRTKKKSWQSDRRIPWLVARKNVCEVDESAQQKEAAGEIVNSVVERWQKAVEGQLRSLKENGVWEVVRMSTGAHVLHTKRVYKTKKDADGDIERWKARLVTCGNEQEFGVGYNITFTAVIDMCSLKVILSLAKKRRQGTAIYVKTDKEMVLFIYIWPPQGMTVSDEIKIVLKLKKALYGLKQAGGLWSKQLHQKLVNVGFEKNLTDICVCYRVYEDGVLVTGTKQNAVIEFFGGLLDLSVKDLGEASKFLGMRDLDQEVAIVDMLRRFGMDEARGNGTVVADALPASGEDLVTVAVFQSLIGSLIWIARCSRPGIAFALHKARTPRDGGLELAKAITRYLAGTKELRLRMKGNRNSREALKFIAYIGAGFAADKRDRKPVTGGLVTLDRIPVS
ncbi:LOW QUALITY PROTEIN: Hypothetical protein PHPALM_19668 [Phytophthora palmivora]|uniref:Uncharacterized protein n=1 Tax=Phytophthora palmivora TaxID=4796 RepID=A0A2P4XGS7_9STRA|nr:LOW QUALITY PROTEIN: Hypothetical protein PHPALM_19668 [Phytophthora palmivora]